jgi:hypothetical protein
MPDEMENIVVVAGCTRLIRNQRLGPCETVVCGAYAVRVADCQACKMQQQQQRLAKHFLHYPSIHPSISQSVGYTASTLINLATHTPFSSGGKSAVNSLKALSSSPSCSCGQLSRTDRMACVAQALLMTWDAKKTRAAASLLSTGRSSFSWRHLNKNIRPYTGLG